VKHVALKKDKLERARKAGILILGVRDNKRITRDELLNYIQAHLSYGDIELEEFEQTFFTNKGNSLPEGM
jgi:hypothetical protein